MAKTTEDLRYPRDILTVHGIYSHTSMFNLIDDHTLHSPNFLMHLRIYLLFWFVSFCIKTLIQRKHRPFLTRVSERDVMIIYMYIYILNLLLIIGNWLNHHYHQYMQKIDFYKRENNH